MWRRILALLVGILTAQALVPAVRAQEPRVPRLFLSDGRDLASVKKRLVAGDSTLAAAVAALRARADEALQAGPFTIVHKPKAAPSGDKHDYVSMAPYWWPDPSKPDGLPYICLDGQTNPEREKYDAPLLWQMERAVAPLALAYYLTDNERYAEHASRLLRVWFLDAETRMNPNLNYAQFISGRTEGRGIGIMDTSGLPKVVDAVGMLEGSRSWTRADQAGLEAWFRAYGTWLRTSKHGQKEATEPNNHGTWYDVQVASYALFVGEKEAARRLLEESKTKRIAPQILPDGRQPLELKRTKSFDYTRGNLEAFFALATLGDRVGVDLWRFETKDGRGIRKALDWLIPYAAGEKKWDYEQIRPLRYGSLAPLLRRAAAAYREEHYEQLIKKLPGRSESDTSLLLYAGPR
jgi:hypothetical protein